MALLLAVAALVLAVVLVAIPLLFFTGADHSRYASRRPTTPPEREGESREHRRLSAEMAARLQDRPSGSRSDGVRELRRQFDARGALEPIASATTEVLAGELSGEWVIAPSADPQRRLLYIHGGGYVLGSPVSHRAVASRLSAATRSAVFSVNYRLMPENPRLAGLEDCTRAYAWLLQNGPNGRSQPATLLVAGDSAGGNLALATVAWVRDAKLRAADAVVVFSPQTDSTLSGDSHRRNLHTDIVQRGALGPAVTAPRPVYLWMSLLMNRVRPNDPRVSPLFGNLAGLPPTLIQVSEVEMFEDDAVRYANKASAQGTTVVLQTWARTLHGWQAFDVPEAHVAFAEVSAFLIAMGTN